MIEAIRLPHQFIALASREPVSVTRCVRRRDMWPAPGNLMAPSVDHFPSTLRFDPLKMKMRQNAVITDASTSRIPDLQTLGLYGFLAQGLKWLVFGPVQQTLWAYKPLQPGSTMSGFQAPRCWFMLRHIVPAELVFVPYLFFLTSPSLACSSCPYYLLIFNAPTVFYFQFSSWVSCCFNSEPFIFSSFLKISTYLELGSGGVLRGWNVSQA